MTTARSAPSTAQARVVVDELLRHGVRDVVLCPGSRSAPLAFALAEAAAAERVRLHVRIDERSAGFLALGLARGSGMVVPIVVTSGTAVANLHPAIVEAHESGAPLLALTANRPPELWGSGANQTIAQVGLFGEHAACVELGVASALDGPTAHQRWRAQVGRAIFLTADAGPRPVQLDIPFQEPLVPVAGDEAWTGETTGGLTGGVPWISAAGGGVRELLASARSAPSVAAPRGADFGAGTRTLVIAGSDAPEPGALASLPTIAEPGAARPAHPVHPLAAAELEPDRIVVLGRPTLQRSVLALLGRADIPIFAVPGTSRRWFNPGSAPQVRLGGIPAPPAGGLWSVDPAWLHTVDEASAAAAGAVAAEIGTARSGESAATGLDVASVVSRAVRGNDALVVGSSNPIRDVALVDGLPAGGTRVFSNRGAAGIDGNVAAAIGVALALDEAESADGPDGESARAARTIALVGDLTFLHDVGALLIGPGEPRPRDLVIVVANDSGGGIFSLLEQGDSRLSAHFERVFGTPHEASVRDLCRGYGISYSAVDLAGLEAELGAGIDTDSGAADGKVAPPAGIRVLEVRTSRADLRERHERIGGW